MATIKFQVKENNTVGTHSFYAQAVSYSTLDIADLADEVSEGLGIDAVMVQTILRRYAVVATRNVLRGHRVKLGDLLTFYPQISASVKDEVDKDGKVTKVATADMLTLAGAKSTIGATVSQAVQQKFSAGVQWKRVGEDAALAKDNNPTGGGTDSGKSDSGKSDSGSGGTTKPATPAGSGSGSASSGNE